MRCIQEVIMNIIDTGSTVLPIPPSSLTLIILRPTNLTTRNIRQWTSTRSRGNYPPITVVDRGCWPIKGQLTIHRQLPIVHWRLRFIQFLCKRFTSNMFFCWNVYIAFSSFWILIDVLILVFVHSLLYCEVVYRAWI